MVLLRKGLPRMGDRADTEEAAALQARVAALEAENARLRQRTKEAARESDERLTAFVNASADAVLCMSPDGSLVRRLKGAGAIGGEAEPTKSWLENSVHPADLSRVAAAFEEAICSESILELEHQTLQEDGRLGWTFLRAVPVRGWQRDIIEWLVAARDVTEGRRTQEKLLGQKRILEMVATAPHFRTRSTSSCALSRTRRSERAAAYCW